VAIPPNLKRIGYPCHIYMSIDHEFEKDLAKEEQEGKKPFDYDIFECPEELKGQLKIGDFFG